jgi:VIT1/CCC1 family predicted Fe2+/Mn2+ transporter
MLRTPARQRSGKSCPRPRIFDMTFHLPGIEHHYVHRIGWLRAAVLGANDGIVSTASLIVGVAAASGVHSEILVAGFAGLAAGAMSMAAGEYVSVSSQADTERADLETERQAIRDSPEAEARELAEIYVERGLDPALAETVATQLMAHDALGAHARDELGMTEMGAARPIQAALTSAAAFSCGAALPLVATALVTAELVIPVVGAATLASLALLGAASARIGGAGAIKAMTRVTLWGAIAMAVTAGIGALVGAAV